MPPLWKRITFAVCWVAVLAFAIIMVASKHQPVGVNFRERVGVEARGGLLEVWIDEYIPANVKSDRLTEWHGAPPWRWWGGITTEDGFWSMSVAIWVPIVVLGTIVAWLFPAEWRLYRQGGRVERTPRLY